VRIDWGRLVYPLFAAIVAVGVGYWGQPLIHDNSDAIDIIVNVFSILAGFLVTIMTLLGEPGLFHGRSWRSDAVKRSNTYRRLVRHKWLFITYLIVLALVFAAALITKNFPNHPAIMWIERLYLGFAVFAFFMSIALPGRLMNLQLARFDEMVENRRKGNQQ
jgi:hypothetical protein